MRFFLREGQAEDYDVVYSSERMSSRFGLEVSSRSDRDARID